jgi:hypothetical protein
MNRLVLILTLTLTISCTDSKRTTNKSNIDQKKFRTFIHRFKALDLPYSFDKLCILDSNINVDLEMDNDSSFIGFVGPCITIGLLPDTSKFYTVLYGIGATCYLPMLAVYKKDGTNISHEQLADGCGVGPGYECFDSIFVITNNLISHKKIEYTYNDTLSFREAKASANKTVLTHSFFITQNGQIMKK